MISNLDTDDAEFEPDTIIRLKPILKYRAIFSSEGFIFAEIKGQNPDPAVMSMPDCEFSPDALAFMGAITRNQLIYKFDWGEWLKTSEAKDLFSDPAALGQCTARQITRMFTVLIRQERFVTGSLLAAFESGLLGRILDRAATLCGER